MKGHTPGPWHVTEYGDGFYKVQEARDELDGGEFELTADDARASDAANARLIAAAPDMLQMLQEVSDWLVCPDCSPETVASIKGKIDELIA